MIRLLSSAIVILALTRPGAAQTVTDGRAWLTVTMQGTMSKQSHWRWSFDSVARSRSGLKFLDITTFRPLIQYSLTTHSSIGGGYAYVNTYPATGTTTEHRVFAMYTWSGPAAGGNFSTRFRIEARLIEGDSGVLWRVRPQARFMHPIRAGSRVALVGTDELNIHLNTTLKAVRGIDQNRAFGGVSITWSPRFRSEIGYLNQFIPGHGNANKVNHVVSTTLTVTF